MPAMPKVLFPIGALAASLTALIALASCQAPSGSTSNATAQASGPANVDHTRLLNADREPGQWMTDGRLILAKLLEML
jgi:quinohemoprotein ethanol dehydrogenase